MQKIFSLLLILTLLISPFLVQGQQKNEVDQSAIAVPEGYAIEAVAVGLSVPTTATFDGEDLIVAESGFLNTAKPRVLRITSEGETEVLAEEGLESPVTGFLMIGETLYISHKGKVSILERNGNLKDIVTDLPSKGDHQNNNIVLGRDGRIYLGQGTVTNTAVVGTDNYIFGWLDKEPTIHDVPCKDVTLTGRNYETENPLTEENDKVTTGAYKPFGTSSKEGEVIKGETKCNGAILSFRPDGSDLKVVAWGLRNPFGLEVDRNGALWAIFHGADVRGSRPINNDVDYMVKVEEDAWYGWPEYFNGKLVPESERLWKNHPTLAPIFVTFDPHAGANGFAFNGDDAFVATFGTFAPITTGSNLELSGFRVLRVNMNTKEVTSFAANKVIGPSYLNRTGGFNRPSDIVFGPDQSMYVVDWGGATISEKGLELQEQTGVVWRIYKTDAQQAKYANGPVIVPAAPTDEESHDPLARNDSETYKMMLEHFWEFIALILIAGVLLWGYAKYKK